MKESRSLFNSTSLRSYWNQCIIRGEEMPGLGKGAKSFVRDVLLGEDLTLSTDSQIYKLICVFKEVGGFGMQPISDDEDEENRLDLESQLEEEEKKISIEEKTKYLEYLLDIAGFGKIDECGADIFGKELGFGDNISTLEMTELLSYGYLDDVEIAIIVESFGLYNFPKKSSKDLCIELGVSNSYIELRKERAIKKLKTQKEL